MGELIIDREGVRTVFKFGSVYCILDGHGYAVFDIDRQSGRQEMYGETTLSPHRAWEQFWDKVDIAMREKLENSFGPAKDGTWVDPDSTGRYIVNIKSPPMRREYHQRCSEVNGRYDLPLDEYERLRFDVDMMDKYREHYPIPPALKWKAESIRIQFNRMEYEKRHPQQV